tara:strand:- start:2944 stop:3942 length:999 start_codon:yes stop_codon:yes gene_type:complete
MDSYGIREAQMAGRSASSYVNEYNDNIRSKNTKVRQDAKKNATDIQNQASSVADRNVAMDAYHSLGAIHTGYEHYQMLKKYGSYSNALITGTKNNIYNLTQGKLGSIPMGPQEKITRDTLDRAAAVVPLNKSQLARGKTAIISAQAEDYNKTGFKSGLNPEESLAQIRSKGTNLSTEGMSLESKLGRGIAKGSGLGEGAAHTVGLLAGGLEAGAQLGMTAFEDFSDGGKKFKSENSNQEVGDVAGMIGNALGVVSTFVPVLAPLGMVASGVSAVEDWIGSKKADATALQTNTDNARAQIGTTISAKLRPQQSTATYTGQTSLQKVSGQSSSF